MRIVDDFPLPIKTVSESRKKDMEETLRRSNRMLKMHHEAARKAGFIGNRRCFFVDLCKGINHEVSKEDLEEILKSKALEQDFLAVYSRMLYKISGKWFARLDKLLSKEDICSAAVEGFLKAFCCFTDENIRFSSYLTYCVERHISKFATSFQNQFRVPLKTFRLKAKVLRHMSEGGLTFDSALEKMNLAKKTKSSLIHSMFELVSLESASEIAEKEKEVASERPPTPEEVAANFQGEFSGLDELVFRELVHTSGNMNLSEVSRRTINPRTGKPYTKMAMSLAWKRVRSRICEKYGKVA